jgi:hypothetical protein
MRAPACMAVAFAALAAAGCHQDGLVVVRVDAQPPISGVAKLHILAYVGERSNVHDAMVPASDSTIPGAQPFTFALYVDPALGGTLALSVDARAGDDHRLAIGRGTASVRRGARTDAVVLLGPDDGTSDTTCIFEHSTFDHCTFAP